MTTRVYLGQMPDPWFRPGKDSPGDHDRLIAKRAVYNNLMLVRADGADGKADDARSEYNKKIAASTLELALRIDEAVRRVRPNAWRGNQAKENVIKAELLPLLDNNPAEVETIFSIIKVQTEY